MAKRKVGRKVSDRKKAPALTRSKDFRTVRNRTVSFFIGVITVLLIGFLLFSYAQNNNYKTVLGEKAKIEQQDSKVK